MKGPTHAREGQPAHNPDASVGALVLPLEHEPSSIPGQSILAFTQREQAEAVRRLIDQECLGLIQIYEQGLQR